MREMDFDQGQFSNLIKFAKKYRVAVPSDADYPNKTTDNDQTSRDIRLASKLTGKDSLETQLLDDIVSYPVRRIAVVPGDTNFINNQRQQPQRLNPSEDVSEDND